MENQEKNQEKVVIDSEHRIVYEKPCVFNCDFCSEDKFFKCNQIGKERI